MFDHQGESKSSQNEPGIILDFLPVIIFFVFFLLCIYIASSDSFTLEYLWSTMANMICIFVYGGGNSAAAE